MTKQEFFEEISTNLFFDIEEFVDVDNIESYDQLYEELDSAGAFWQEVIYYTNAMDFLKKNDASLNECLEIADEYGYQVRDLNSEILATVLKTKLCKQDFFVLEGEINEFLNNYKN